jgi:hypothetical protein
MIEYRATTGQVLALATCVVQLYGIVVELRDAMPEDRREKVDTMIKDLGDRISIALNRLEGSDTDGE